MGVRSVVVIVAVASAALIFVGFTGVVPFC